MSLHQAIVASEYLHEMMLAAEENKVVTTMLYSLQIDFLSHGHGSLAGETVAETRVPDQSR